MGGFDVLSGEFKGLWFLEEIHFLILMESGGTVKWVNLWEDLVLSVAVQYQIPLGLGESHAFP
jgi:hypothetical protein